MTDTPSTPHRSRPLARLGLAVATPLLLVALIEFVVITLGLAPPAPRPLEIWSPKEDRRLADADSTFQQSSDWLWEPRPGAEFFGDRINDDGYRGPAVPSKKTPGRLRIATLGDSTTFGFGLPERECWSRKLETALRERGVDVEVQNFGCIGHTIAQGTAMLHGRVRKYDPDLVVFAFGAVNEQFPTTSGMTDAEKILFLSSTTARIGSFFTRYATVRWLHELSGSTKPLDATGAPEPTHTKARVPLEEFPTMYAIARADLPAHAKLVVVSPPRRADGERDAPATAAYTQAIVDTAKKLGLVCADVHRAFRSADEAAFGQVGPQTMTQFASSSLFLDQWHPTAAGHTLYANTVVEALVANGLIPTKSPPSAK